MKARLRLIAAVEKGSCLPFDTQIAQEADFLSKGRSVIWTKCHSERWLPIQEKLPLPFDTQNAHKAVFASKGRSDFLATGLSMRRMMISQKEPLPFDTQIAQEAVLMSKGRGVVFWRGFLADWS